MKQIFSTLLILIAGVIPAVAQSMLKVSLSDRRPISVSIDGRHFRKTGESITINDLPKGRHDVVVYISETRNDGRRGNGVIWEGNIKTYRGELTICTIDPRTREAAITEQDINTIQDPQPTDEQRYNNYNLNNYDTKPQNTDDNNTMPATQPVNNEVPAQNINIGNLPAGTPVASPVEIKEEPAKEETKKATKSTTKTDPKVLKLKKKIEEKSTDTDRLVIAKDVIKANTLTTAQVVALMDCFSFESTRVEFVQYAYPKTTDKKNFKQVKQKLTMKNYKDEMDQFLKDNK